MIVLLSGRLVAMTHGEQSSGWLIFSNAILLMLPDSPSALAGEEKTDSINGLRNQKFAVLNREFPVAALLKRNMLTILCEVISLLFAAYLWMRFQLQVT